MDCSTLRHKFKTAFNSWGSYHGRTDITFQLPAQNGNAMVEGSLEYEVLFQRPNLIKIIVQESKSKGVTTKSKEVHLISDGKRVVDYRPNRSEYTEHKVPGDTREFVELIGTLLPKHGGRHWLGLRFMFICNDIMDALLPPGVHVHRKGTEVIGEKRVERIVSLEREEDSDCECTFWFGIEDSLLWRFKMDIFEVKDTRRQKITSYCENHYEIQVNTEIAPECFVFHPPTEARRVQYLPSPLVSALHGKPAPLFCLPVCSGGTLSLSDLKEQVIVIVCWSLGCPACPPALDLAQKLHKEFASDKLCVLGVTSDEPRDITQILNQKGIEFKTLLDRRYEFMRAYAIQSIPRFYIINKGVVQVEIFGIGNAEYMRGELRKALSDESSRL